MHLRLDGIGLTAQLTCFSSGSPTHVCSLGGATLLPRNTSPHSKSAEDARRSASRRVCTTPFCSECYFAICYLLCSPAQGSAQILCCNTEAFDNPVTKKREDKDIDTTVPKPYGPQRPAMVVGLLSLCQERSTVRREGHLMSRVRVRSETEKKNKERCVLL